MWLGYVDNDVPIYDNYGIGGFAEEYNVGGAIKLESNMLQMYKGGRIVGLAIGYSSSIGVSADIFIREDINGQNICGGNGNLNFGWNIVDFDEPVLIGDDTKDLFFGFYVTLPAQQYAVPTQMYAIVGNSCYLWTQDNMDGEVEVWEELSKDYGMLVIKAVIECDGGLFDNMVELISIRNHNLHIIGNSNEYILMKVKNVGMNSVNSLGVTFNYNGEEIKEEGNLGGILEPGKTETVQITFPTLGTGTVEVTLDKANGEKNKLDGSLALDVWGIAEDVAAKYKKRPLLEFFESETNSLIQQYKTEYFMPGFEPYADRISVLARHCDDQYQMGDNEDLRLLLDLVDNDSMNVYIPTFSLDRMDNLSDPIGHGYGPVLDIIFPDYVSPVYEEAVAMPTFASVNIASEIDESKKNLKVTISGEIEEGIMGEEPIFLSVYVTENNVDASSQQTKEPIVGYVHNNVIRLQPTDMYGLQLENNGGAYSESFDLELEKEWKIDDMKIVACLNRGPENGYYDKEIINSAEFDVKNSATGLYSGSHCKFNVYAGEGNIIVEGAEDVEIYDVQGNRIMTNSGLYGLYVVKVYTQDGYSVYKVFVK